MPSPMSVESRLLLRLLEDGEWHDLEEVHVKLAATIAPGKALRRYEERAQLREAKEGPRRGPELSDEEKIASGQRTLAGVAINSMKKRYIDVVDDPEHGRRIRRKLGVSVTLPPKLDTGADDAPPPLMPQETFDGRVRSRDAIAEPPPATGPAPVEPAVSPDTCPTCGLYVVNKDQHEEFHSLREDAPGGGPPAAVAFFSEEQVRQLIAAEVGRVVDEFQSGMQGWLVHRFAALEAMLQGLPRAQGSPSGGWPGRGPSGLERSPHRPLW